MGTLHRSIFWCQGIKITTRCYIEVCPGTTDFDADGEHCQLIYMTNVKCLGRILWMSIVVICPIPTGIMLPLSRKFLLLCGCCLLVSAPSPSPPTPPDTGFMKSSRHGGAFRITGPLWGESTGHRWIPLTRGQTCETLMHSLLFAWIRYWTNTWYIGALKRHDTHMM